MKTPFAGRLELEPGLFALGGAVRASRAGTWVPPTTRAWLPVQCYALRSGDELLLIDAGLAIHREQLSQALKPLVAESNRRSILTTRREPDTIVNLPWLVRNFGFRRVLLSGLLNPLDYFESFEFRTTEAQFAAAGDIDVAWLPPGQLVTVGDIRLVPFQPLVRVLSTDWFFEQRSGTLFTSDFGGFFLSEGRGGPFVWRGDEQDLSAERIAGIIGTKFEWLRAIDTAPMIANIKSACAGRDVRRICPSFGGIVEGRENVARVLDCVFRALELLSRQPRQSSLQGFDWDAALANSHAKTSAPPVTTA
jgi:hypothetical protein